MKKIFLIIPILFQLLLISIDMSAQAPPFVSVQPVGNPQTLTDTRGASRTGKGYINKIYTDTTQANLDTNHISYYGGAQIMTMDNNSWMRDVTGVRWLPLGTGGVAITIPGGPITTIPTVGFNPGTDMSSVDWIITTFYGAQPPLATLTGGGIHELTSDPTLSATLNWGASRQAATTNLATIVVATISQVFIQPSAPGTVSGTQGVTVTTNTSTTYNNVVTASNGQSATASTTFTYENKIYAGFVSTNAPSDADIIAATGSTYVGGEFSLTRLQSGALSTPGASSYVVFAAPATFGTPTVVINGLTVAYNLTTRAFVNASGYSSSYIIAVSPFPTSGQIDVYSVQ